MRLTGDSPYAPVLFLQTALVKAGHSLVEVLGAAGYSHEILDDSMAMIPREELNNIWKIASDHVQKPAIGFWASQHCDVAEDYGLAYHFFVNLGKLQTVLEHYFEGHQRFNPTQRCGLHFPRDGQCSLFISTEMQENWFERQYTEASVAGVIHLFREITNYALQPDEVSFQFSPAGPVEDYEDFFGCSVKFNRESSAILFPEAWLQIPTIENQQATARHLQNLMNQLLPSTTSGQLSWEQIVSRKIRQSFGGQKISLPEISRQIGLKEEQLKYALSKEGYTFSKVLEEVRKQEAINKLTSSDWSVSEISSYLGYSESSTFTRNFRQWFGDSPNQYRKTAQIPRQASQAN